MASSIPDILAQLNAISFSASLFGAQSSANYLDLHNQLVGLAALVNALPTASAPIPPAPTGSTPPPTGSAPIPTGSIAFNYSFNNMNIGELIIATAMLDTSPVTGSVTWTVAPAGVVSLVPDLWTARLTALAPGKATLTATLADGRTYTATGSVVGTVPTPPPPPPTGSAPVVIKTITVSPALNLMVGANGKVVVKAVDASGKDITAAAQAQGLFTLGSENTALMTVDQTGNVHALAVTPNVNVEVHVGNTVPSWAGVSIFPSTGSVPTPPAPTGSVPAPTGSGTGVQAVRADDVAATMGIGTHFSYNDLLPYAANQANTVQLIKDSGFRFVRDGLNTNGPPPSVDYRWTAFKSLTSAGVKMMLVTTPQYIGNGKYDTAPYSQQGNIDFAVATLGTSGILAFEGPNEVDNNYTNWGGSTTGFGAVAMQFQTAMYNRVKAVAPSVKVLGFTVTSQFGASHSPDLSNVMDGQAIHPYPGAQLPANAIAGEKAFFGQYMNKANKPYWITETGYHTAVNGTVNMYQPGVSEAAQAKYTPRVYLMSVLNNVAYTAIYEFIDEHADLTNAESNYGLVRNDGTPKPAYTAMKNLLSIISEKTAAGATFTPSKLNATFTGLTAPIQSLVMQKSDGRFIIAIWQEVSVYNTSTKADIVNGAKTVSVSLGSKFSKANIYTPTTTVSPISTATNPTTLNINVFDQVTLVELIP